MNPITPKHDHNAGNPMQETQSSGILGYFAACARIVGKALTTPVYLLYQAVSYPFTQSRSRPLEERDITEPHTTSSPEPAPAESHKLTHRQPCEQQWKELRTFLADAGDTGKSFWHPSGIRAGELLDKKTRETFHTAYNRGACAKDLDTTNRELAAAEAQLLFKQTSQALHEREKEVLDRIGQHLDTYCPPGVRNEATRRMHPGDQLSQAVRDLASPLVRDTHWNSFRPEATPADRTAWFNTHRDTKQDLPLILDAIEHFAVHPSLKANVSLEDLARMLDQARFSMTASDKLPGQADLRKRMTDLSDALRQPLANRREILAAQ